MLANTERSSKPRANGHNYLIDGGLPTRLFEDYVRSFEPYIDGIKFGWGSGLATPDIDVKVGVLQELGIKFWFGGTAFEIAYTKGKLGEFVDWTKERGAERFEISDGVIELESKERQKLVKQLSKDFEIVTEVGSKDAEKVLSPSVWVEMIKADFESGAARVILEGRESGAAGMYRKDGEVRTGLIDDVEISGINMDMLIFEAPKKQQQIWFIERFGRNCNLGNLPFDEILNVETLRQELRADTFDPNQ